MDREPVTVRSYANIAIIKYWGKKKEKEKIQLTIEMIIDSKKRLFNIIKASP